MAHQCAFASTQQVINQQQRQQALQDHLLPEGRKANLSVNQSSSGEINFKDEKNCFYISKVVLQGGDALPRWLPLQNLARQGEGRCIGSKGIGLLMRALQNKLVSEGYITTLISAPNQDLKGGVLTLNLVAGQIGDIRLAPESWRYIQLLNAFPTHSGNILNLRDIEQGQENVLRLPCFYSEIKILPGEREKQSDIAVNWQQKKMWRLDTSLDDTGLNTTGRYQGSLTLSLDNPLSVSVLFYISANSALQDHNNGKKSEAWTTHYSVPFGYWMAGFSLNRFNYQQVISGLYQDFLYKGSVESLDSWLKRVLYRDAHNKTVLTGNLIVKSMRNYIEDVELDLQRRRTTSWRLGVQHDHSFGASSLSVGASYQQGARWFGALPAPEELSGQASAMYKIVQVNARFNFPFQFGEQHVRYITRFVGQTSNSPLTPQDQMSIGNRWTVRGFDGQRVLSASHGWYVRNDFAWRTPVPVQELFLGADYGQIGGYSSAQNSGKILAGSVVGLRGAVSNASYDIFAGTPLSRPKGFTASKVAFGFNLSWSY